MNGFIDRIEQTPDGRHVVIDFKSGKKPGTISKNTIKKNIQINMYCLAVQHMTGSLPERAELFFLKDGRHVHYVPNEETIQEFTETILALINDITRKYFPANPHFFRVSIAGIGIAVETNGPMTLGKIFKKGFILCSYGSKFVFFPVGFFVTLKEYD